MTIDPLSVRRLTPLPRWTHSDLDELDVDELDADDLDLDETTVPDRPMWHRCGSVHCVERGPWIGTLVCCVRQSGHEDAHAMSLGDAGAADYWRESWF